MIFNNEQTIFDIPSLSFEWIFPAQLFFNGNDNLFYICDESKDIEGEQFCKFTIFHTITGDINQFDVTCRDFNTNDFVFEFILEPILSNYCKENLIELKFDHLI